MHEFLGFLLEVMAAIAYFLVMGVAAGPGYWIVKLFRPNSEQDTDLDGCLALICAGLFWLLVGFAMVCLGTTV